MFDATAHIASVIARLPPCSLFLDVFYPFHNCYSMKETNEDTLVAMNEKLSPSRKKKANEEDDLCDATAHIADAIARLTTLTNKIYKILKTCDKFYKAAPNGKRKEKTKTHTK